MEATTAKTPNRGYHMVRIAVAGLLLTASVLKCWQLATEPIVGNGLLDSRWLLMATVEFELFFGIWLLANLWAKPTWAAALACFGLFTCVSLCKAISGHATCGCFGQVAVNPWYTGTLDLAIIALLLRWRPRGSFFATRRAAVVVLLWLAIGLPAAYAMGSYTDTTLSDVGQIIGNGKIIVLEPEKWIGKRFPLLRHIDIGDRLREGKWLVLLYRNDCPECVKALQDVPKLAQRTDGRQLALVEIPPRGDDISASEAGVIRGRLSDDQTWLARTPIFLVLDNGRVLE
jgi:hypothetical protein